MSAETPWSGRRLHFVGIGGGGMSGLALVARALGAEVTGSDRSPDSAYLAPLRGSAWSPPPVTPPRTCPTARSECPTRRRVLLAFALAGRHCLRSIRRRKGLGRI